MRGKKGYRSQPHVRVPTFPLSTPLPPPPVHTNTSKMKVEYIAKVKSRTGEMSVGGSNLRITSYRGGGAITLEGSMGTCHPQDSLFQAIFSSGDPPFQALFVLAPKPPPLFFFENKMHFQAQFSLNFSS